VAGQPDVELLEASFQALLEFQEELAMGRIIFHIHEDAHQFIVLHLALMLPLALDDLGLARSGTKMFT
jgi:hypothetical protein